ncbi:MAG: c-type cytochrome [Candidatus Promineifilaceae bacterium]
MKSPAIRFRLFAVLLFLIGMLLASCGGGASPEFSDPVFQRGQRIFKRECTACHSTKPGVNIVGPSLDGIASRAGTRVDGLDSRAYIYRSITKPSDYVVDGFVDQMPTTFRSSLTDEELDDLINFLLTLE